MESELTISQVTKIYGNDKRALNEVSLVLTPGVYGLVGPNGAGKSTLMNIFDSEFETNIWNGELLRGRDLESGATYRAVLGYMPQQQVLAEAFTRRAVFYGIWHSKGMKRSDAKKGQQNFLTLVNLDDVKNKRFGSTLVV